MTVNDLIEILSNMPADKRNMTVFTHTSDGYYELHQTMVAGIELAYYPTDVGDIQVVGVLGRYYPTIENAGITWNDIDVAKLQDCRTGICV